MKNFKQAHEKLKVAAINLHLAMVEDFPMGCTVFYEHGKFERQGVVNMHGYDQLRIISPSGKQIWIDAYRIEAVA